MKVEKLCEEVAKKALRRLCEEYKAYVHSSDEDIERIAKEVSVPAELNRIAFEANGGLEARHKRT